MNALYAIDCPVVQSKICFSSEEDICQSKISRSKNFLKKIHLTSSICTIRNIYKVFTEEGMNNRKRNTKEKLQKNFEIF